MVDNTLMDLPLGFRYVLLSSGLFAALALPSFGNIPIGTEDGREGRVLKHFDFEFGTEGKTDWSHVFHQEPGLPPQSLSFFIAETDTEHHHEGEMSLRLEIRGGSISYRTAEHVVIPVKPDAAYQVETWVRTENLNVSAARLEARVIEEGRRVAAVEANALDPIFESTVAEFTSMPIQTEGEWKRITLPVHTNSEIDGDLRLVIALQVVQPSFLGTSGVHSTTQDLSGKVWFDDLTLHQKPSVHFATTVFDTGRPTDGIIQEGTSAGVRVAINDPIEANPTVHINVFDLDGIDVYTDVFEVPEASHSIHRPLPQLQPGWYELHMNAFSDAEEIASTHSSILVMKNNRVPSSREEPVFGPFIHDWTSHELNDLATALDILNPGVVEYSVWPVRNDAEHIRHSIDPMQTIFERQRIARRQILLAVDRIHPALAEIGGQSPEEVEEVLASPVGTWIPGFERLLLSYGTTVDHWRIGKEYVSDIPDELRSLMDDLVGEPVITTPEEYTSGDVFASGYLVAQSSHFADGNFERTLLSNPRMETSTLRIESAPLHAARRERMNTVAMNILSAWRLGAKRIITPMNKLGMGFDETWLAWTNLGNALSGRRFDGELYATHTARCLVAANDQDLRIIAYTEHADGYEEIDIPLGEKTVNVHSIDGRAWTVSNASGVHRLSLSDTPIVISEADSRIVSMASSMSFEPRTFESMRGPQFVEFKIKNPYEYMIEGALEFEAPENWSFEPKRIQVRLEPNTETMLATTVRWTRIPTLGVGSIGVRLVSGGPHGVDAQVEVPFEINSSQLSVTGGWARSQHRDDAIVVTAEIQNKGQTPISLEPKSIVALFGRKSAPRISNLKPGERVTRRFLFEGDIENIFGSHIRVSLQEVDGPLAVAIDIPVEQEIATSVMVIDE